MKSGPGGICAIAGAAKAAHKTAPKTTRTILIARSVYVDFCVCRQRDITTGIFDSMMIWRVAPPKIIWRMRLCV